MDSTNDELADVQLVVSESDTRVVLSGEIDMECRPKLAGVLDRLPLERPRDVRVDLAEVTFLSSDGLAFLVQLRKQVTDAGNEVVLEDPRQLVQRLLGMTGLDQLFPIVTTQRCENPR